MSDIIFRNGRFATMNPQKAKAEAVAVRDGKFYAVGTLNEVREKTGNKAEEIDLRGWLAIPGLHDSHLHLIRGGLNYNMELRWDGVPSLADGMRMLKEQVATTPPPQWVRVVGGFTFHQFSEKRLPTLDELNAVAPETPVFILHLYDRALLNRAALAPSGTTKTRRTLPVVRSSGTPGASQPACCWPSPTPTSSTPHSPRGRSCRWMIRRYPPGSSCAS